jgi:hypothetical protein
MNDTQYKRYLWTFRILFGVNVGAIIAQLLILWARL